MAYPAPLAYYYNGNIITMNPRVPRSPHMLVSSGRVWHCDPAPAPLGLDYREADFSRTREKLAGQVRFVDLQGKTVVPGFCDAHAHFLWWGVALAQVDLHEATSEADSIARIKAHAGDVTPGEWITGGRWAHNLWPSRELPSLESLDQAFPDNPVMLSSKCGHLSWVNSAALKLAGVTATTPDPDGGEIDRRDGRLSGILKETAIELVSSQTGDLTEAQRFAALERGQKKAHSMGITSMHTPEDMDTWEFMQVAHRAEKLSMRINFWVPVSSLDHHCSVRARHGLGDHRLRISAVKIFTDGSLGGRTALMYEPYEGEPDNLGIEVNTEEEIVARTLQANRAGLSMAIHAIGDKAVGYVLNAYEQAAAELGTAGDTRSNPVLRNRIEHLQVYHSNDLERIRKLKPIVSMQPIHLCADMGPADRHWGSRAPNAYAMRTLKDAGCLLAFGSDIPVEPGNPLWGVYAAITRNALDKTPGDGWNPQERITMQEALEAYTINTAIASGEQDVLGSLEPGKFADFVILPDDPFEVPADQLLTMDPLATISEGEAVYAVPEWEEALK